MAIIQTFEKKECDAAVVLLVWCATYVAWENLFYS